MMARKLWVLGALPLMLAGCGGGEAEQEGVEPVVIDPATAPTAAPSTAPMDAGMEAGTAQMGDQVQMTPVSNSGVSGEGMISEAGQQTQVMVRLTGLQPNSGHAGHIHQGTCDNMGSAVVPLQDITAGADGAGTMTTTVSVPMMTVMNGQHLIAYHQDAGQNHGPTIVCGNIPSHSM